MVSVPMGQAPFIPFSYVDRNQEISGDFSRLLERICRIPTTADPDKAIAFQRKKMQLT